MINGELLSTESIQVGSDAYIEGLHVKYDFYKDVIGIGILCFIGITIFSLFIGKD